MAGFDLTILTRKVEGLKAAFDSGRFADALVGSLNTGNGLMQQRIFGANQDVKGNGFGQYVGKKHNLRNLKQSLEGKSRTDRKRIKANAGIALTYWERKRVSKGRQIAKKDLEFTGVLRRAIETQVARKENERSAVLEFNNNETATVAHGQEQQITNIRLGRKATTSGSDAVKIFTFNDKEREQIVEQGKQLIIQILKQPNAV